MRQLAAEPRFGPSGRGPERGRIAGAPRFHSDRHGFARDALDRRNDGPDGRVASEISGQRCMGSSTGKGWRLRGISTLLKNAVPFSGNISLMIDTDAIARSQLLLKPPLIVSCSSGRRLSREMLMSCAPLRTHSSRALRVASPLVCIRTWMPRSANVFTISGRSLRTNGSPPIKRITHTPIAARLSAITRIWSMVISWALASA